MQDGQPGPSLVPAGSGNQVDDNDDEEEESDDEYGERPLRSTNPRTLEERLRRELEYIDNLLEQDEEEDKKNMAVPREQWRAADFVEDDMVYACIDVLVIDALRHLQTLAKNSTLRLYTSFIYHYKRWVAKMLKRISNKLPQEHMLRHELCQPASRHHRRYLHRRKFPPDHDKGDFFSPRHSRYSPTRRQHPQAKNALSVSAEGDCYLCVLPDPGIEAAALGASESALPGTAPAETLYTFTLDSGASCCVFRDSTTLTPLSAPVPVGPIDPSEGPVLARSSTILPCSVVSSGSLSGLHLPSFPTNLVSTAALQDAMVTTTTPGGVRVRSGSTPLLVSPPVAPDSPVAPPPWSPLPATLSCHALSPPGLWSFQVFASPPTLTCPALPFLRRCMPQVRFLPPLPPSPAPPCLPCVEGRQRAAPHSSSFPPTTTPLQTLHMDVWGLARVSGQGRERYFLLVVDDYTRYTTVFPLRSKGQDHPIMCLHSDRGGEFSSDLLRDFCRGEGILQSFTLPDSPQQNGIAEHRIGLVMEVAHTSMIHAAAPHFLWPFAVRYAAHQLNLWPRDSLPETSLKLRWTGEVGDASVFRDVTFNESVPFYRLFPERSAPPPPPPLFLAPGPPPVDHLPPHGPAPSGVSQVDPLPGTVHVEVAGDSGAARGAASRGAEPRGAKPGGSESEGARSGGVEPRGAELGGAEPGGAEIAGVEPGGAEPEGVEPGGAESEGVESRGAEPQGTTYTGGPADASPRMSPRPEPLSPQQLHEWFAVHTRLRSGAAGVGDTGAGGARAGARGTGELLSLEAQELEALALVALEMEELELVALELGALARDALEELELFTLEMEVRVLVVLLQPASPLPAPPYFEQTGGLTERREPASCPTSPVRTDRRVPRPCPPPVPGTHAMALRPSSVPLRDPLLAPPEPSLPGIPDPEFDLARATSPTVSRLLASVVTDPSFESTAACALIAELVDLAASYRLDYAAAIVAESASASPPSIEGECALGTNVLEDKQEDFECLAAAVPRFASMLLALEGDQDAPDIPTSRSYPEAITGPYSSHWQAAMDAEMASWKSTGTYVDTVPPSRANIVDGMWIFRVKWLPGSLPAFKARYVTRGFSQREGVGYFQTFSPTPKMTTLRVLLHVAAQRDYELHSLDFSTFFLLGSLHEEIWLRRPPGPTGTTLAALGFTPPTADPSLFLRTDTSLPPFYVLVYVDITRDRARRTITLTQSHMVQQVLQRFGFQFSSPQPTPLSTGHSLSAPPSDKSVEASGLYLELVSCLTYLMTCTLPDLAYPLSLLARYVASNRHRKVKWDVAKRVLCYLCCTLGMGLVLGGQGPVVLTGHADASWVDDSATEHSSQGYTFSLGFGSASWRSTRSSSVLSSSCEGEIYAGAMAAQELCWLTYPLTYQPRTPPVLYVENKAMIALCQEHRQEHRTKFIALRYCLARELQQRGQLRLAYVATRANTADIFVKALLLGDYQRFCTVLGLVPTLPHLLTA
ncbi:unnamed protein product [Closterium sp. NIES-53]